MTELIIVDLYGTIIKADERDGIVRDGFLEFLDFYKDKKKVIFSDGDAEKVEEDLRRLRLTEKFDGVYDSRDCVDEIVYAMVNEKFKKLLLSRGGGNIKNLEKACRDFSVPNSEAVFIGDNFNGRDSKSAEIHAVRFIKVPQYRANPPDWLERERAEGYVEYENPVNPFSFKSLIGRL